MSIWAHTLVKNEERYLWFAVASVIDYVDKVLLWDTGSSDKTVEITKEIQKLYPDKVEFKEVGDVDINQFTVVRQNMLERTEADWFMIVDGDEVWWKDSIAKINKIISKEGNNLDSMVTKYYNVAGDIFHYQEESAGMYEIDAIKGHLNIRAVNRKILGIHFKKPHGQQGVFDKKRVLIQERDKRKRIFLENPAYLHFTNMLRSSSLVKDEKVPKRKIKFKYELGIPFPFDFYYPEVFFEPRPDIVPSPWIKRSLGYCTLATLEAPLKLVKRRLTVFDKSGY